jgi:hypothetical protein
VHADLRAFLKPMENLTHSLIGATLAELFVPRSATPAKRGFFFTVGVVAANLPDERRIELKVKSTDGTIITIEEEQISLLRSLRFKQFLVAVVSRSLESILGRKVTADMLHSTR